MNHCFYPNCTTEPTQKLTLEDCVSPPNPTLRQTLLACSKHAAEAQANEEFALFSIQNVTLVEAI